MFSLLRENDPARGLADQIDSAELDAARARALTLADAEELQAKTETEVSSSRLRPRRETLVIVSCAVLCAAVISAAVALLPGTSSTPPDGTSFDDLAAAAAEQPELPPPSGYSYQRSQTEDVVIQGSDRGLYSQRISDTQEEWFGQEIYFGSTTDSRSDFPSDSDRELWIQAGRPTLDGGIDAQVTALRDDSAEGGRAPLTPPELAAQGCLSSALSEGVIPERPDLPTDRTRLEQRLRELAEDGRGTARPDQLLSLINLYLTNPLSTPELRSALFEVAGRLEGLELDAQTTDPDGRSAASISLDYVDDRSETGGPAPSLPSLEKRFVMWVDPDTSQVLATRELLLESAPFWHGELPATVSSSTYTDRSTVDRLPSPAVRCQQALRADQ